MNLTTSTVTKHAILTLSVFAAVLLLACSGCDDKGDDPVYTQALLAPNGDYYRLDVGSTAFEPELKLGVRATDGRFTPDEVIRLSIIEGDGTMAADSVVAGSGGFATVGYDFTGSLGHAVIQAVGRGDADTLELVLRTSTLIPGQGGQGQYVLLDDLYREVVGLNGRPARVDSIGTIAVANYEAELGVVVICYDVDKDGVLPADAPVYGVIVVDSIYPQPPDSTTVNVRYNGMTADSIGIGSSYRADIVPVYGPASSIELDEEDPSLPAIVVSYDDLYLTFWCYVEDTTVFQIDIFEDFDEDLFPSGAQKPRDLGFRTRSSH